MTMTLPQSYSDHALSALRQAATARTRLDQAALEPEHLLAGLAETPEGNAARILTHLRVNTRELARELDLFLRRTVSVPSAEEVEIEGERVPLGLTTAAVLGRAAAAAGSAPVGTEHLLTALLLLPSPASTLLRSFGVTPEEIDRRFVPEGRTAGAQADAVDLVEQARRGELPPLVERPALLRELSVRLLSGERRAVLLTGEPGSGRASLALLLARALAAGDASLPLPRRLVRPAESVLLADPVKAIRAALQLAAAGEPAASGARGILWLRDLPVYFGGSTRTADAEAGALLREAIGRGEVRVLGSATPEAARRQLGDAALFDQLTVPESSAEEAAAVVELAAPALGARHNVTIAPEAREAAVSLAKRYGSFTGVALPGSALRVLERACVEVRLAGAGALGFAPEAGDRTVDAADVAVAVSALTGIATQHLTAADAERLAAMEEHLRRRVIGQDEALNALSRAVRRARMGFKDPKRPVGSFMFLGGSGVGKTESARALAEFLFGAEEQMVRLDMSEYADKHTIARMIGAPPGYVGYEEGGQLTEAVRRRPETLILFDEVEKAHPDVLTIMLQILEDGRLTDGKGRTVDFRQAVIILTSNVGTQLLKNVQGAIEGETKELLEAELRRYFRVEFLNRLDKIIFFRFLAPEDLARILDLMLNKAVKRAAESEVGLEVSPAAREWLLGLNDEPEFGARPLRRIVQDQIEDALVERLLRGEVMRGQTVRVDRGENGLTFTAGPAEAAA